MWSVMTKKSVQEMFITIMELYCDNTGTLLEKVINIS